MTVASAHLYRYSLPFTAPVRVGEASLTERQGVLLRLKGEAGALGWGEAAPLPGFSGERGEEAAAALREEARTLVGRDLSGESPLQRPVSFRSADAPASVRFAVDSAVLELRADAQHVPVHRLLGSGSQTIFVNALVGAEQKSVENTARTLRAEGYRALKLKVGRFSVQADAARVRAVDAAVGEEVELRLDANRAWTTAEARSFAEQIEGVSVAYVEEPLADPRGLSQFTEETGLPVALDETTRESAPGELTRWGRLAAVVLKPTLLGGGREVRAWVASARAQDAVPVFSAAYESGVGLRMLVALASVYSTAPAGMSTYTRLDADVLTPRLSLHRPEIEVEALYDSRVDGSRLDHFASYE